MNKKAGKTGPLCEQRASWSQRLYRSYHSVLKALFPIFSFPIGQQCFLNEARDSDGSSRCVYELAFYNCREAQKQAFKLLDEHRD